MGYLLLNNVTATNGVPSATTDGIETKNLLNGVRRGQFALQSRAGSATMTATARLWGMLEAKNKAVGSVICSAQSAYTDEDAMAVISDGVRSLTFEADKAGDGISDSSFVAVDISTVSAAADVAQKLLEAIHGQWDTPFKISATRSSATLTLVNELQNGTDGNVTITADTGTVSGMSGGLSHLWVPLGSAATAGSKGVLNLGNAIGETDTDKLQHSEIVENLDRFKRLYCEITAIGGTATAVDAFIIPL